MPNENPPPPSLFAEIETVLHALSLYGAAGLAAFGWAMGWLMDVPAAEWLPLWVCAALLIYNADRLRRDPADALNVPARTAASVRLRGASSVTLTLAALVLIGLPVWRRDWVILVLIIIGAIISLSYSIPILGFRWKDLPLVKTLFAPTVVTVAIFSPTAIALTNVVVALNDQFPTVDADYLLRAPRDFFLALKLTIFLAPWAWCHLLFNMLLCDLRDRAGDMQCGIRSIPVVFGEKGARTLLWALAVIGQIILVTPIGLRLIEDLPFAFLALFTGLYQAYLLLATRRPRSERFYEWAVEGLLYVPAVACGLVLFITRHMSPMH